MRTLPLILAAVLLAACGQTGPLYLPDEGVSTPVEIRGPEAPAPAAGPPAEPPADEDEDTDEPPSI